MLIAIDLETHPITESVRLPRPVCMSVCAEDGYETLVAGVEQIRDTLRALLDSPHTVIAHNGAGFDFPVLAQWCDNAAIQNELRANRLRCTMLWAQLADFAEGVNHSPNGEHYGDGQGYGLAAIVKRKWGAVIAKGEDTWRMGYAELENVPLPQWPAEAQAYVMNDSRLCLAIAKSLRLVPDVARKTRQFFWLALSSARGAYTDVERAAEWRASLEVDCKAYAPHLRAAGVLRADGTRDQNVLRKRIADAANGDWIKRTAGACECGHSAKRHSIGACTLCSCLAFTGRASADKEACELSHDPLVKLYSLYTDRLDKLSKEVKTVETGIVRTRYQLVESGRTSSSKPALQNIGKTSLARRCFRARPGFRYVVTDYGMLELCAIAQLCNVMGCGDNMGAAIRAGKDLHTMLAQQIDPSGDPKAMRRLAKEGNFGRNGGMGWKTLVATAHKRKVEIDEATARRIIQAHKRQWPEIAGRGGYHDMVQAELNRTGGVLEHYRSGRLRGGLSFTQGANTLFQGLGSDVGLDAFTVLGENGLLPDLYVHDSFHNEVTEDREIKLIGEICYAAGAEWLPFAPPKADPKEVNDWSEAS